MDQNYEIMLLWRKYMVLENITVDEIVQLQEKICEFCHM